MQAITEQPIKKCPECGKNKAQKLISNTSFVLKGSGWYSDGYSTPGSVPTKEAKEAPAKKADSKPATKTEKKGGSSSSSKGSPL